MARGVRRCVRLGALKSGEWTFNDFPAPSATDPNIWVHLEDNVLKEPAEQRLHGSARKELQRDSADQSQDDVGSHKRCRGGVG